MRILGGKHMICETVDLRPVHATGAVSVLTTGPSCFLNTLHWCNQLFFNLQIPSVLKPETERNKLVAIWRQSWGVWERKIWKKFEVYQQRTTIPRTISWVSEHLWTPQGGKAIQQPHQDLYLHLKGWKHPLQEKCFKVYQGISQIEILAEVDWFMIYILSKPNCLLLLTLLSVTAFLPFHVPCGMLQINLRGKIFSSTDTWIIDSIQS